MNEILWVRYCHESPVELFFTFRAFITLQGAQAIRYRAGKEKRNDNLPDNGSLDDILSVFVDSLENICRLRFDFSFDGKIEVHADLEPPSLTSE